MIKVKLPKDIKAFIGAKARLEAINMLLLVNGYEKIEEKR